jgi:hypothetical protein
MVILIQRRMKQRLKNAYGVRAAAMVEMNRRCLLAQNIFGCVT